MNANIRNLSIVIFVVVLVISYILFSIEPQVERDSVTTVEKLSIKVYTVQLQDYPVTIESYGNVIPDSRTDLTAQVPGKIVYVSNSFQSGGSFNEGDLLLRVDQRDYIANVKKAKANLILAKQKLIEEEARSIQAQDDWDRLGQGRPASNLVLNIPQLESAKAALLSAEADLSQALTDLERTDVTAPYKGRVVSRKANIGQMVSSTSIVGDIYSTNYIEVRLPIKNKDLAFIKRPFDALQSNVHPHVVTLSSDLFGENEWSGVLNRLESVVDSRAHQLFAIARIKEPYKNKNKPLLVGQYLTAKIQLKVLKERVVIPNEAIYQGSYVYIEKDGRIFRKNIEIQWQNTNESVISDGILQGDNIVVSPLGRISSGTAVHVVNHENQKLIGEI